MILHRAINEHRFDSILVIIVAMLFKKKLSLCYLKCNSFFFFLIQDSCLLLKFLPDAQG